jgi:ferrous iron transport protein A
MGTDFTSRIEFKDLKIGMKVKIKCAKSESHFCVRLQEMGLTEGTEFTVIKVAPLGDPVEVDFRGSRLCLRKCEACGFELDLLA